MPGSPHAVYDFLLPHFFRQDASPNWPLIVGASGLALGALHVAFRVTTRCLRRISGRMSVVLIEQRMSSYATPLTSRGQPAQPPQRLTGRDIREKLTEILQLAEQASHPARPDDQRFRILEEVNARLRHLLEWTIDPSEVTRTGRSRVPARLSPPLIIGSAVAEITLKNLHALLIDESPNMRQLIGTWLDAAGALVTTAINSRDGMDLAVRSMRSTHPFDAILIDLDQTKVDGLAAVSTLRQLGYAGRIVAFSSSILASEHQRCYDAGCCSHLIKPLDRPQLLTMIDALRNGGAAPEIDSRVGTSHAVAEVTSEPETPVVSALANDPELQPMLAEFIGGLRQHADVLTAAFQDADLARVRIVAHQLARSAGTCGFESITVQALAVESALQKTVADTDLMKCELESLTALCRRATGPRVTDPS